MNSFIPHYKPNQLILGTGQVAIVTGWTPRNTIAKHLDPSEYAVIGQLYSPTRGISYIIRNILANPCIRAIVILDATKEDANAGGCQCLKDFFFHGVREGKSDTGIDCWVINSRVTGYVDKEIPFEAIESLPNTIVVAVTRSIGEAIRKVRELNASYLKVLPREPMIFPYTEPVATVFPGERYGHRIEGKTIAETWVKILHRIKTSGTIRPTGYDGKWQELIDLMAVVTDEPEDFYFPEPNYLPIDREYLVNYIPQILEHSDYEEGVKYTYGQRLRSWFMERDSDPTMQGKRYKGGRGAWRRNEVDQIQQIIEKLIAEPDAASAVANLWDVEDHVTGGSPCLNHIWVRIVDNELSLTATFRSNDMFSAWPANAMGLRALQRHIMDEINDRTDYGLVMGPLITVSQSAHIYDDCWENVDRLIAEQYKPIALTKIKSFDDPVGSFLIECPSCTEIKITRITPGSGEIVGTYKGKDPLKLIREIAIDCPAIYPEHLGYLGIELEKARRLMTDYIQDRK